MSTIDFHAKISGHEAFAWIKNCLENHTLLPEDEEQLCEFIVSHKPKDFKNPRKPRASKKSSKERASDSYDPVLCDAMTWNDHLGAQCDHKKMDGQCFCKRHFNENEKNGATRFGIFLMDGDSFKKERYTHAFNDTDNKIHLWDGVERPKKDKTKKEKKSSGAPKGTRKCSVCGECGHDKRKCPHKESTEESTENVTENVTQNNTENILPPVDESTEDTGAGTGLRVQTTQEEFVQARVELSNTIAESTDSQETVLLVPDEAQDSQNELDEDLSHDADPEDEEESTTITIEGITYNYDKEDCEILDGELSPIGEWLDGDVVWKDDGEELRHMRRVKELKASGKCA